MVDHSISLQIDTIEVSRAIKRRFGDGSMDELPYGRTVQ